MIDAATFWSLPRSTRPAKLFEEILPEIPALMPVVTLPQPANVHVLGGGGGVWNVRLVDGRAEVGVGEADDAIAAVAFTRKHLREIVGGALHHKGVELMKRLGRPGRFPDLSRLPVDPSRTEAVASLRGSVAIEVHDRTYRESYRFVITLGGGEPAYDQATTTVRVDADEVVDQLVAGVSIAALLKGSRVRIEGDLGLPLQALRAAFGGAIDQSRSGR